MSRFFNIAGPCIAGEHYMIDSSGRLGEIQQYIERRQYFVIHAARQTGKTTILLELEDQLNKEGQYYVLYCSLEVVQGISDPKGGIPAVVSCLK